MLDGQKITVVLPAYNAGATLRRTYAELDRSVVDDVILVDDASRDDTVEVARELGIPTFIHPRNRGYGGNQKTCYAQAIKRGADVVVMVHPDYQYSPKLVASLAGLVTSGHYDIALGSRIVGSRHPLQGGMPLYKYVSNRLLTATENLLLGAKLTEYHTGFRAYSARVLRSLPIDAYDDDFIFDNQILAQAIYMGWRIGEISCPALYFPEASSINFRRSCKYGIGVLETSFAAWLARKGLAYSRLFPRKKRGKDRGEKDKGQRTKDK